MTRRDLRGDNIIDSRDVIKRIAELESDRDSYEPSEDGGQLLTWADEYLEEAEELKTLQAFAEEGENNVADWSHGACLILDSYFETYAREFADDIGALGKADSWPYTCIDWEQAAEQLQQDYSSISFDGETYWGLS